ncbi:MAG: UTP--glucose-1-phosphate uridylyltransferase, partial [Nitrospiraceae bacterium]
MSIEAIETIVSEDASCRDRSVTALFQGKKNSELIQAARELEHFRKSSGNLYHKVRASLFLSVLYRNYLPSDRTAPLTGEIPFEGIRAAFERDFETALDIFHNSGGCNSAVFSALADSYYRLSFQYLADQVRLSISQCRENHHLYHMGGLAEYPFTVARDLTTPDPDTGYYPVGVDSAPVRLDPSHSGWSDIFFLGMDYPEGARVVNISVNLKVHGSSEPLEPPCECYCRYIEEPVIRLISVDLMSSKDISSLAELFNFGNDHLSLLKAGVVASGAVPPCFEKSGLRLEDILRRLLGKPGGIEIVTSVKGIPKGSRLAVSTTLLSTIITRLMRFSGQIKKLTGGLDEQERRTVASRAILGEWLGGSGGGWQDSGGLWPGMKIITGQPAREGDPEYGISRGCLLPHHEVLSPGEVTQDMEKRILDSMVLVHGGISQNVGPVLEMVTAKYLLKYEHEWSARLKGVALFDRIVHALKSADMKELGRLVSEDWETAIQGIIPWVNNAFTEELISRAKKEFGHQYWGFLMLGGMSGGGMAFIVDPEAREAFMARVSQIMGELKEVYGRSYPFIIEPLVYDFDINHEGIVSRLLKGKEAKTPQLSSDASIEEWDMSERNEPDEETIKELYRFDTRSHDYMKALLKRGEIGLARNRLPRDTAVRDVTHDDVLHFEDERPEPELSRLGLRSLSSNEAAVVTFAGGMGSRWSQGAAVVKPVNPFIRIKDRYRTFIECHLAKSRYISQISNSVPSHVFTTSYLTHDAISTYLQRFRNFNHEGRLYLSPSWSIGHRVYPMERDLRFFWEEQYCQKLDENVQKVQDDAHRALIEWAKSCGEGEDYAENRPVLRFNPPGHWYEIPNLIRNGTLAQMIKDNSGLKYLFCHNIDTLGAWLDPNLLGMHIRSGASLTFEVTPRRIEDAGGGLANVQGHVRIVEGLALPREEDEYRLSYYNTLTNW